MYTLVTESATHSDMPRTITITLELPDEVTPMEVAALKAMALVAEPGDGAAALAKLIGKHRSRTGGYMKDGRTPPGEVAIKISDALGGYPSERDLIRGYFEDQPPSGE